MGLLASRAEPVAVSEVNILRYAGTWYELATLSCSSVEHHKRHHHAPHPQRDVVLHYTAKQRGSALYIEATRQSIIHGVVHSSNALLLPDRRYYPMVDGDALTVPGHFLLESTDPGARSAATPSQEYLIALLDAAEYRYALVLDPRCNSAMVLSRGKTLRQSEWVAIRDELARQLDMADVERQIRWTAHDGVEEPVVADETPLCTFYM